MPNSKNPGALLRYSKYTAEIFDENGTDQGPMNITDAQNDEQARDLAKRRGMKWLEESGLNQATVQIYRRGHSLPIVKVHTGDLEDEWRWLSPGNAGGTRSRRHKILN
jgi:hypothetical protein